MRSVTTVALLAVLLAACGGGDDSAASGVDDEPRTVEMFGEQVPYCEDVWVEGETLPSDYGGCARSEDEVEAVVTFTCDDTEVTIFDGAWWAPIGGEVRELVGEPTQSNVCDELG